MEGTKKIKSTSFHQYLWNSEVETTWISLIGWHHKTSTIVLLLSLLSPLPYSFSVDDPMNFSQFGHKRGFFQNIFYYITADDMLLRLTECLTDWLKWLFLSFNQTPSFSLCVFPTNFSTAIFIKPSRVESFKLSFDIKVSYYYHLAPAAAAR